MPPIIRFPRLPPMGPPLLHFQTRPPLEGGAPPARRAFALERAKPFQLAERVRDLGDRLIVAGASGELEVFATSDSLRWRGARPDRRDPPDGGRLPDEATARKDAESFLRARSLWDDRARVVSVTRTDLSREPFGARVPIEYPVAVHVNYRFWLGAFPVRGPGAKMRVSFGADGKVAAFYKFWREPTLRPPRARFPPRAALDRVLRDESFADLRPGTSDVTFGRAFVAYYAAPPRRPQRALVPVYAFEGTVSTPLLRRHDFVRYVMAMPMDPAELRSLGPILQLLLAI